MFTSKRNKIIVIIFALVFYKIIMNFMSEVGTETLLIVNYVYLVGLLVSICALVVLKWREIIALFSRINSRTVFLLVIIILFSLAIRLEFSNEPEPSSEIEWEYKAVAKDIATGQMHEEYFSSYRQHPRGYPMLMSSFYLLFGASDVATVFFNALVGSISVFGMFILFYLLFGKEIWSLMSALILGLFPQHIFMSGIGEVEVTAVFLIITTLISYFIFVKTKDMTFLLLTALIFAYAVNVRLDFLTLAWVLLVLLIPIRKKVSLENLGLLFVLFIGLMIPVSVFLKNIVGLKFIFSVVNPLAETLSDNAFTPGATYSLVENAKVFFQILFHKNMFLWIYYFFIPFAFLQFRKYRFELWFILLYLINGFITYGLIFSGVQNLDRYILLVYPGLVLLLTYGCMNMTIAMSKKLKIKSYKFVTLLILLMLATTFSASQISYLKPSSVSDVHDLRLAEEYLQDNSLVAICAILPCEFDFEGHECSFPDSSINRKASNHNKVYYIRTASEANFEGCSGDYIINNKETLRLAKINSIEVYEVIG